MSQDNSTSSMNFKDAVKKDESSLFEYIYKAVVEFFTQSVPYFFTDMLPSFFANLFGFDEEQKKVNEAQSQCSASLNDVYNESSTFTRRRRR